MRLSDIKLTAKSTRMKRNCRFMTQSREFLGSSGMHTAYAQISGGARQNVAQAGAASDGKQRAETLVNGGLCHGLTPGGRE